MRRRLAAIALAVMVSGFAWADGGESGASCKLKLDDYYPPKAIRLEQVGTVLVEYSVKREGPPVDVVVIRSAATGTLKEGAIRVVRSLWCSPSAKWIEDGGPARRSRVNVLFKLKGFDETAERLDPDADEIVVTATAIIPFKK